MFNSKPLSSMYILCLSWCPSVCLYSINVINVKNVKTVKPIRPQFFWDLTWPQGRIFKSLSVTNSNLENFENSRKFIYKIFVLFLFYSEYKAKMFTIEIEDGRGAPYKPSLYIFIYSYNCYGKCSMQFSCREKEI